MICIITVICTFISNHLHLPNLELFNASARLERVPAWYFHPCPLQSSRFAFVTRVFVATCTFLACFPCFSPLPRLLVCLCRHGTLEITGLSPLSWKLLDRVCFVCPNPFSFYTIPLSISCYSKSEWLYVKLGYHHVQGSTSLILFTCLYSVKIRELQTYFSNWISPLKFHIIRSWSVHKVNLDRR